MIANRNRRRTETALERRGVDKSALQPEIFKTPEAAAYVRLSKPTLERLRLTGDGPQFCKLGGAVRYRRSDLDDWLASRLVRSTSEGA